jgi:hypothetical protein
MAAKRKKSTRRTAAPGQAAAPGAGTNKPRIARVAKGKRPQYFSDPAIDKLLSMTVSLMEELSVTRDRLDAVERLLDRKRTLRRGEIESFVPDAAAAAERDSRRAAFIDRVMRVVQAELEELSREDMPRSSDEVVAAVAS